MRIDFQTFEVEPVPLRLEDGWRLVTLDSGERHTNAGSAYNERRAECSEACELLGVDSLRQASWDALDGLPRATARTRTPRARREHAGKGHGGRIAGRRPACRGTLAERFPCELARPVRGLHARRRDDSRTPAPRGRRRREDRRGRFRRTCPRPAGTSAYATGGRPRGACGCRRPPVEANRDAGWLTAPIGRSPGRGHPRRPARHRGAACRSPATGRRDQALRVLRADSGPCARISR